MNRDTIAGNWKQLKGKVKERWGEFTDDELDQLEGKRDQIIGKRYQELVPVDTTHWLETYCEVARTGSPRSTSERMTCWSVRSNSARPLSARKRWRVARVVRKAVLPGEVEV